MKNKYIFTTAQKGAKPNFNFLIGLDKLSKKTDAEIQILPTNGKRSNILDAEKTLTEDSEFLNPIFEERYKILDKQMGLNSNIYYPNFRVKAQQMIPYTSLERFSREGKSFLIASPKQMLKTQPWSNEKYPRIIWSTGSCTLPNYRENSWGDKARKDHQIGAIFIDILDNKRFHIRPLLANTKGTFYDLGKRYNGDKRVVKENAEFVVAETHTHPDMEDKVAIKGLVDILNDLKPRKLILHDVFDGHAVNWWYERDNILKARRARSGRDDLEEELKYCYNFLKKIQSCGANKMETIIVRSNHDERLDRYLRDGRYVDDPLNMVFASKLIENVYNGDLGIQAGFKLVGEELKKVKFLTRNSEYRMQGFQLGLHGDKGTKGTNVGSVRTIERFAPKAIIGHKHAPEVFRGVTAIGGLFKTRMGYNKGPIVNIPSVAIGYKNKRSQLVNIIDGKYK